MNPVSKIQYRRGFLPGAGGSLATLKVAPGFSWESILTERYFHRGDRESLERCCLDAAVGRGLFELDH